MKFIFGVLLLAFAVFLNSIEKSSQSGEEPPFPLKSKWRLSVGIKGFPKRPVSSESAKNTENPLQNHSRGPVRQENLSLAKENKNLSEGRQHSPIHRSQFSLHPGSSESGSVNPQLRRENEYSRQYRPKGQTSQENLPEKFQHPVKPVSKSKGSSKPKNPKRDPGDPDDPGVVFWLPTHN
ncbi:uncharacterized protein LOC117182151 [Belonocnema kinseyi]|uniref:uncharacterized protein LOC117182151 n=1 Tax=Belonocnema kinseyi TaxID=2817044 RepID=UPI00143DCD53|nr:uncharacterized protein LOC117182151 [Belonocnema kinseyi]